MLEEEEYFMRKRECRKNEEMYEESGNQSADVNTSHRIQLNNSII